MGLKSNDRFVIYPLVKLADGFSISDGTLINIWNQLEREGKIPELFYDGGIRDLAGWLEYIKSPSIFPILAWDTVEKSIVHIAWLTEVFDIGAWVHHCAIGPYRRGAWEAGKEHWKKYDTIKLLIGKTPETNKKAVKFLKLAGFTAVGTIPLICNMAYEGKRVGGVISYIEL